MTKEKLDKKVEEVKNETKIALETMFNELNNGQKKKLLKNEEIIKLFDRYNVEY